MLALITGASSGIGRDMARILASKGYDLALVARNQEGLDKIKAELERENVNIKINTYSVDLAIKENLYKLYEDVKDVDILINNAGFGTFGRFTETDLEKEVNMINTNVTAVHVLTKLYLKDMIAKNAGHILNVASIAGFMPGPLMATYYATKAYIVRLSEGIREELRKEKSNVKISILCPGPVSTNFTKVANVKFSIREANSMNVAKYAIKHLNRFYIVPGLDIKLARFGTKIVPSPLIARITYKVQKRKLG